MINLIAIAAIGKNYELGKNNDLIWKIKEDLNFFKETTTGYHIVMGRKTYESMPKNLPNRKYIVISSRPIINSNVIRFENLSEFLNFANKLNQPIFVIGGETIYTQLLPYTNTLYLTEINEEAQADIFFPKFNKKDWTILPGPQQSGYTGLTYHRNIYIRKKKI